MRLKLVIKNIFWVLIISFLGFLCADFISRFFFDSLSPIERIYHLETLRKPKPYVMFSGTPNMSGFNTLGYVGRDPSLYKKKAGDYRIFLLGGSTLIDGPQPIPLLLEEKFRKKGFAQVFVYNFGVISSNSNMSLARIVFEISDYEPDLIIMYNGWNDLYNPLDWDPRPGYPFNFLAYEVNPLLNRSIREYPFFPLMMYGSNILRFMFPDYFVQSFTKLEELRNDIGYFTDEWKNKIVDNYANVLIKAHKISNSFGADFMIFYQPLLVFKNDLTDSDQEFLDKITHKSAQEYYLEMRELILQKIASAGKPIGLDMKDLSHVYDGYPANIYIDVGHTNQEAKNVVSDAIFEHIVNNNKLIRKINAK